MSTKLSATAFVHWHWTFPPERKLIFTNEKTPCANQIEDRPNSAIVTWKRSWLLHKYNWRALWQLIIQGKKVHAHPANKKTRTIPLPSVGNFTLASQMWSTRTLAIYHCRQKSSTPIHLSRTELSTPLAFRRKIFKKRSIPTPTTKRQTKPPEHVTLVLSFSCISVQTQKTSAVKYQDHKHINN